MTDHTKDPADIIKRLRAAVPYQGKSNIAFLCHEAADALEALARYEAERETGGWRDIASAPRDGGVINVRSVTSYKWTPYKSPNSMTVKGRWQAPGDYGGWENAPLPERGEWQPLPPGPTP